MALLTVMAAFVFQARADGSMPGLLMPVPVQSGTVPQPSSQSMPMGHHHSMPMTTETEQPEQRSNPTKEHNHSAHCPFCVTNAFALDDGVVGLPNAPPSLLAQPIHLQLHAVKPLPRTADARAPPEFAV